MHRLTVSVTIITMQSCVQIRKLRCHLVTTTVRPLFIKQVGLCASGSQEAHKTSWRLTHNLVQERFHIFKARTSADLEDAEQQTSRKVITGTDPQTDREVEFGFEYAHDGGSLLRQFRFADRIVACVPCMHRKESLPGELEAWADKFWQKFADGVRRKSTECTIFWCRLETLGVMSAAQKD